MPAVRHVAVRDGDVLLLVGTMKGAFVLRSTPARSRWEVGGPYFPGQAIYALAYDGRGSTRRLWAGTGSEHWGPMLSSSDDFGETWTQPDQTLLRFPEETGATLKRIWQIRPGRDGEPGVLYAGVEPAALFESKDDGATWSLVRGLYDHPHRALWQPGGGGLGLHTVLPDPQNPDRMWVAISTGGVYRTDDSGRTWQARNRGVRAQFLPDPNPEFGQCVHKIAIHPRRPSRMFLQNHWGLYRSDDAGDSWQDIANGVPSDFGFPIVAHPHDPDTAYIVPLESDMFRCTPEGRLRVYRTRDAGGSWEPLTKGLPQQHALETVLRDALDADLLDPAGIYFGTRNGTVWSSSNGGASWSAAIEGLPPVVCVKAAVIGDPARAMVPRASARATAKRAVKRVKAGASKARAKVRTAAAKVRGGAKTVVARTKAKAAARRRKQGP